MKLVDLRKHAIANQQRIRFRLQNGMDCLVNESGVAQVPSLRQTASFNLEQEVSAVDEFVLEPVNTGQKNAPKPRTIRRDELEAMFSGAPASKPHHDEHEDE